MPEEVIETSTYPLPRGCATTTLLRHPWFRPLFAAEDGCYSPRNRQGKGRFCAMGSRSPEQEKRLAEALRANLKRRKAAARQATERATSESPSDSADRPGNSPKSAQKPA